MATGLGKTVTFAAMLQDALICAWLERFPENDRRMLIIAHREELLDQSCEKIQRLNPGVMVSIEQGARRANRYSDVVIASIQTLAASQFKRLHELIRFRGFRLVVVDEAHHAAAPSYRTVLSHLGFLPPEDISAEEDAESATEQDAAAMARHLSE
jgi:superfamily II DNA or RNA helicase